MEMWFSVCRGDVELMIIKARVQRRGARGYTHNGLLLLLPAQSINED